MSNPRAVAYIRKSNQPGEGNKSLEDQRSWAQREASRRGFDLLPGDIFEEVVSGWRDDQKRPARDQLEAALGTAGVAALLVRDLDRLGRRQLDITRFLDMCRRQDVSIVTEARTYNPSSSETALLIGVMGGLAESEATRTSERLKRTAENVRQRGGWNGPAPYGWMLPEERNPDGVKTLKLHPDESKTVRQIVDWRLDGLSIPEIVRKARSDGFETRTGKPFQYRTIASMLRHPVLAGYNSMTAKALGRDTTGPDFRDTREIVMDAEGKPVQPHEPVCTVEEWETLRLLMKPQPLKQTRSSGRGMLLTGLLYCAKCGSKMTSNRSAGHYVCNGRMVGLDCRGTAITAGSTEQWMREATALVLADERLRAKQSEYLGVHAEAQADSEAGQLQEQADALQESLGTLREAVASAPTSTIAALLNRIREEEAQLHHIELQIAERSVDGRPRSIPSLTPDEFMESDEETQRRVMLAVIKRIEILPDDGNAGAVKGLFGSQGVNRKRILFWYMGDPEDEPRQGSGYSLLESTGNFPCPDCDEPRVFKHERNLRHHMNFAHPKPVPCPECGEEYPLPGIPSHRLNKHGVRGKRYRRP